ncbi:hypothetical protein C900_04090 [Fulvivirga imtechensis AK7]|uniref:Outer membrane protein beta-barrel domain-containing protein n=1 Tax=Fulvivirga imtechensis AK7 TaxID=1237149 RepID=L8JPF6_9BACT|nr:porin family protein [Fulvivirga imtechensis]ELR70093.1 hypothetical protein C900_04090 [Fulvivirga imtechensis AK7]
MRKVVLFLLTVTLAVPLFGQQEGVEQDVEQTVEYVKENVNFGLRAGLNFSSFVDDEVLNADRLAGVHLGFYGRYNFSNRVAAKAELIYSMQGARADEFSVFDSYAVNLNYLKIPVLGELTFGDAVTVELGPYIAFLLDSRQSFKGLSPSDNPLDVSEDDTNSVDLGIAAGLAYKMSDTFSIGARYNHGFIDALGSNFFGRASGQNSVIQISGFYAF